MRDPRLHTVTGITWRHTRGITPWRAAAQVWEDRHPDVRVLWDVRSLWEFGEGSIDELFGRYDMVVLDHPFVGEAVERGYLRALDTVVDPATLRDLAGRAVGRSFDSYRYAGRSWGFPTDAACLAAAWRPDLLARLGWQPPANLDEVVQMAAETSAVAMPMAPIDVLSVFFTLAANVGARPCHSTDVAVPRDVGRQVLADMRRLTSHMPATIWESNPIRTLNVMATSDAIAYCPYTYSYSNYARPGYQERLVAFGPPPDGPAGNADGACLGGAGLVISSRCEQPEVAGAFAAWAAGAECQRTTYGLAGGQPGHVAAWDDDILNGVSSEFFRATRPAMDAAFLRPNHHGFASFQRDAGGLLHDALRRDLDANDTLDELDARHRHHLEEAA